LIAAKKEMDHGEWIPWLKDNFGWSRQTANNYMRVAEAFKLPTVGNLKDMKIEARALYLLSAPTVPDEVREEASANGKAKTVTLQEAKKMVADHDRQMAAQVKEKLAEQAAEAKKELCRRMAEASERHKQKLEEINERHGNKTEALEVELERAKKEIKAIEALQKHPTEDDAKALMKKFLGVSKLSQQQIACLYVMQGKPVPEETSRKLGGKAGNRGSWNSRITRRC